MNQLLLINMKKENDSARSFLREVSAGRAGNDGPYFSPCRAKGGGDEKSIKDHPLSVAPPVFLRVDSSPLLCVDLLRWHLPVFMPASSLSAHHPFAHRYRANVSEDEEYEMLLSSQAKKTRQEPAKEAALQRTINLKLRQATQELLNKRNGLAEKLCRLDDGFAERERSYKKQMETFSSQIRKEQALRMRAEEQKETYKKTAESQTAHLQAVAGERDNVLLRLQTAQEELASRSSMEEETRLQLVSMAGAVNEELLALVEQLHDALEQSARAMHARESELQVPQKSPAHLKIGFRVQGMRACANPSSRCRRKALLIARSP
jgi:hypothetical protein